MKMCLCGLSGGCTKCNPIAYTPLRVVEYPATAQKGWECPKCGRCYAPYMIECWICNNAISNGLAAPIKVGCP